MDAPEPDATAFDAVSAQTNRILRVRIFSNFPPFGPEINPLPIAEIPSLPRRLNALCSPTLGLHNPPPPPFLPPHRLCPWLVHRRLLPRYLPSEPLPCLPATKVRSVAHTG